MWIYVSLAFFALALADVVMGATGSGDILNDVQEMVVMLVTTIFFVMHILMKEALEKNDSAKSNVKQGVDNDKTH